MMIVYLFFQLILGVNWSYALPRPNLMDDLSGTFGFSPTSLDLVANDQVLPLYLDAIQSSDKFVYLNFLSVSCDPTTERIIAALERKAITGTDVRLAVNKAYSYLSIGCLNRLSKSGVKILKAPTHSSYLVNDQQWLLIGSQSLAWMFFVKDKKYGFDRDHMLSVKGLVADDAIRDFIDLWTTYDDKNHFSQIDLKIDQDTIRNDEGSCRFLSQRPHGKLRAIEKVLTQNSKDAKTSIVFSGVNIDTELPLVRELKQKSLKGLKVQFIGNGKESGNGELTMELNRWLGDKLVFSVLTGFTEHIRDWDMGRVARDRWEQYSELLENSKIDIRLYKHFLHYKTWSFDDKTIFVGSPNLNQSSLNKFYESGVICTDTGLVEKWKKLKSEDLALSTIFSAGEQW